MVAGSDEVVMDGAGLMVSENALALVPATLSVTFNLKLNSPAAGGVPVRAPPAEMVSHGGSVVAASAKVYGGTPPDAETLWEYGRLTVHEGSGEAVVMVTAGFTVTVNAMLAVAVTLSVAVTVKVYGVAEVTGGAVPVSAPAGDRVSQTGKLELDQAMAGVPPVAVSVWE